MGAPLTPSTALRSALGACLLLGVLWGVRDAALLVDVGVPAFGLALLLGLGLAEGLAHLQLPRVLGYIAAGLVVGPTGLGLTDLSDIDGGLHTLAWAGLGVVAFFVASGVRPTALRGHGARIVGVLAVQGGGVLALTGAGVLALAALGKLPGAAEHGGAWLWAFFGVALWPASTALYGAIAREAEPRGDTMAVVRAVTVLGEIVGGLVVVVLLVGHSEGASRAAVSLVEVVAAGAVLGLLLTVLRRIGGGPSVQRLPHLLLVVGSALLLADSGAAVPALGIAGLLVGALGGRRRLAEAQLWRATWPLFAVLATTVGLIPLDPAALVVAIPLALLRGGVVFLASTAAISAVREESLRAAGGWVFLAPGIVAAPFVMSPAVDLPDAVLSVLQAAFLLTLVASPVALRYGLARAGCLRPRSAVRGQTSDYASVEALPEFGDSPLGERFRQLEAGLEAVVERFESHVVRPQSAQLVGFIEEFRTVCLAGFDRLERAVATSLAESGGQDDDDDDDDLEEGEDLAELAREVRADVLAWLRRRVEAETIRHEELDIVGSALGGLAEVDHLIDQAQPVSVHMEPERYAVAPRDGVGLRALKLFRRGRRMVRRALGAQATVLRMIRLRDLLGFHLGAGVGRVLALAQSGAAVQRTDVWRKCRILLNRLDQLWTHAAATIADPSEETASQVSLERADVEEEFGVVLREIEHTGERVVHRFRQRLHGLLAQSARAAQIAGTAELPAWRYHPVKVEQVRQNQRVLIMTEGQAWEEWVRAVAAALVLRLEAASAAHVVEGFQYHCAQTVGEQVIAPLYLYPEEIAIQCRAVRERIERAFLDPTETEESLRAMLHREYTTLDGFMSRIALGELSAVLEPETARRAFDGVFGRIEGYVGELPEAYVTVAAPWEALPDDASPPATELRPFPFRSLVRKLLEDEIRLRYDEPRRALELFLRDALSDLRELERYLRFNFEAAEEALQANDEREADREVARSLAFAGLDEASERAQHLAERASAREESLAERLEHIAHSQTHALLRFVEDASIDEAERRVGAAPDELGDLTGAREAVPTGPQHRVDRAVESVLGRVRETWAETRQRVQSALGMTPTRTAGFERTPARPAFERFADEGIPAGYRRLFEVAAYGVEDILAGQDGELAALSRAIDDWRHGHAMAVAVVGERGSGRTTLIERALRRHLSSTPLHRRQLGGRIRTEEALARELALLFFGRAEGDLDGIIRRVAAIDAPTVVVVEELQNLLLRTAEGFTTWRRFLDVVHAAGPAVLWIVTAEAGGWGFLDTVLEGGSTFTRVVSMRSLTRPELEEMILRRHRVTGFGVRFLLGAGDDLRDDEQPVARRRYFDALWRAGRGHPVASMFLWLDSVDRVGEADTVLVGWPTQHWTGALDPLRDDELVDLAAVLLHGRLTAAELAALTRSDRTRAASRLARLASLQLVQHDRVHDEFRVNPVLHKIVFDGLRARHLV